MAIAERCLVFARKNKKMIFANFKQHLLDALKNTC